MHVLCLILFFGPAQTISGKYIQHAPEFMQAYPAPAIGMPEKLLRESAALARLIEQVGPTLALYVALGDALYTEGDTRLAFRAYDRAHRMDPPNPVLLQQKKDRCEPVAESLIRAEEHEAKLWVDALQSYERARLQAGEDPRDLEPFYARYGRPEEDLGKIVRGTKLAFWAGALSLLLGIALLIGSGRLRRRVAALPLALSALCLAGALMARIAPPYLFASCVLAVAAIAVAVRGRRSA